ncbi:hypothetical protein MIR68_000079 [Amoeboaphelidium protococcarum]|nr:hypothetical protein MIR68_000079 [Amoeboaphelidium protococcarum]
MLTSIRVTKRATLSSVSFMRSMSLDSLQQSSPIVQERHDQVMVSNVSPIPGSHIKKQRVGRGGKRGGSSGRGNGGQKHHDGPSKPWFTGLTTNPIIQAIPRWSWAPREVKPRYRTLNLDYLQFCIESGRLKYQDGDVLTMRDLKQARVLNGKIVDGVKLLGNGAEYFKYKISIEVSKASKTAIAGIEKHGGSVTCVYHTRSGLKQMLRGYSAVSSDGLQKFYEAPVLESDIAYYRDPQNRGYLADEQRFENVFRPRGYLKSAAELLDASKSNSDRVFAVDQPLQVEDQQELLQWLEQRRQDRLRVYEHAEKVKAAQQKQMKEGWKQQQWFKEQPAGHQWIIMKDDDTPVFNHPILKQAKYKQQQQQSSAHN